MRRLFPPFFLLILFACSPNPPAANLDRHVIAVYADPFTEGWLPALYTCADRSPGLLLSRTADVDSANLILRVSDAPEVGGVAYQLGEIEFVVVINAENSVAELTSDDVQTLYTGKVYNWAQLGGDDAHVQVWAYNPEAGLNDALLDGDSLSSLAKQAQSPGAMWTAVVADLYAIGFLPHADANVGENIQILSLEQEKFFPVVAISPEEDQNILSLIQCLQ